MFKKFDKAYGKFIDKYFYTRRTLFPLFSIMLSGIIYNPVQDYFGKFLLGFIVCTAGLYLTSIIVNKLDTAWVDVLSVRYYLAFRHINNTHAKRRLPFDLANLFHAYNRRALKHYINPTVFIRDIL